MNIYDYESLILAKGKINLKNKTVCFTGRSVTTRDVLEELAVEAGAVPKSRVTKTLDYLIYADNDRYAKDTSKYELAKEYKIKIISESEFLESIEK